LIRLKESRRDERCSGVKFGPDLERGLFDNRIGATLILDIGGGVLVDDLLVLVKPQFGQLRVHLPSFCRRQELNRLVNDATADEVDLQRTLGVIHRLHPHVHHQSFKHRLVELAAKPVLKVANRVQKKPEGANRVIPEWRNRREISELEVDDLRHL
jgi:hypothetical protein